MIKKMHSPSFQKHAISPLRRLRSYLELSIKYIAITFLVSGLFQNSFALDAESEQLEIKLKAAYLYNFLRFVEWPENTKLTSDICVYGIQENYKSAFNSMAALSKKSRKLNIKLLNVNDKLNNLNSCQIIFITAKADHKSKYILDYLKDKNSLTIGESPRFIQRGGMINFIRVSDKVKFEINDDAAKAVDLKIPSKVLRIAERLVSLKNE